MRRFTAISALLVLFALIGALIFGTPLPALAQAPSLRVGPEATLVAKGAALLVPVRYSCLTDTAADADIHLEVRQRVGGGRLVVGTGFVGSSNLILDGSVHTVVITVRPYGDSAIAFHPGKALVEATFSFTRNGWDWGYLTDSRVVKVGN